LTAAFVRILLADNSAPWRRFLHTFVKHYPTWQVIAESFDGLDTIERARDLQPDLILLDVGLPGLNGIEAARKISEASPTIKILFLSAHTHPVIVQAALNAGGLGYVTKLDASQDLPMAVAAVLAGKIFVSQRLRTDIPDSSEG
jgi:DNA-binding NarL/FixJ family response regulator